MVRTVVREGKRRSQVRLAFVLFAFVLPGCVGSFDRDWRAAQQCPPQGDNLAGLWEGTWLSHDNGHSGKLRAIVTKCDDGHYRARYHATFAFVIPYAYETTHSATTQEGVTHFTGEEDLGYLAGGYYYYDGQADGESFYACYRADKDHGVFRMRRVRACCCGDCGCCSACACH